MLLGECADVSAYYSSLTDCGGFSPRLALRHCPGSTARADGTGACLPSGNTPQRSRPGCESGLGGQRMTSSQSGCTVTVAHRRSGGTARPGRSSKKSFLRTTSDSAQSPLLATSSASCGLRSTGSASRPAFRTSPSKSERSSTWRAIPAFRKYISGEVWLLGDVDRAHLVNIDRTSFNREAPDYRAVARLMQREITRFKAECVQAPQRGQGGRRSAASINRLTLVAAADKLAGRSPLLLTTTLLPDVGCPARTMAGCARQTAWLAGRPPYARGCGRCCSNSTAGGNASRIWLRVADDGERAPSRSLTIFSTHGSNSPARPSPSASLKHALSDPPLIVRNRPRGRLQPPSGLRWPGPTERCRDGHGPGVLLPHCRKPLR